MARRTGIVGRGGEIKVFAKIRHTGLNHDKTGHKLHGMISEGYRNKFRKQENRPEPEIPPEKAIFLEEVEREEARHFIEGCTFA